MRLISYAIAIIAIIGIMSTGCAKKAIKSEEAGAKAQQKEETAVTKEEKAGPAPETQQAKPVEKETVKQEEALSNAESQKASGAQNIADIFFDYDRFSIREDAKQALEADAKYLKTNQNLRIVIEGHCDERGTAEYNMALGERRAQAVQKYLTDLGVVPSQISIISYGKEKPFCTEHSESCWQENRRAHFAAK